MNSSSSSSSSSSSVLSSSFSHKMFHDIDEKHKQHVDTINETIARSSTPTSIQPMLVECFSRDILKRLSFAMKHFPLYVTGVSIATPPYATDLEQALRRYRTTEKKKTFLNKCIEPIVHMLKYLHENNIAHGDLRLHHLCLDHAGELYPIDFFRVRHCTYTNTYDWEKELNLLFTEMETHVTVEYAIDFKQRVMSEISTWFPET